LKLNHREIARGFVCVSDIIAVAVHARASSTSLGRVFIYQTAVKKHTPHINPH